MLMWQGGWDDSGGECGNYLIGQEGGVGGWLMACHRYHLLHRVESSMSTGVSQGVPCC